MKNLFDPPRIAEVKKRLASLRPDSPRQWGTMNAPQALAHVAASFELALGDNKPPRVLVGRLFGGLVKRLALKNDDPIKRNSPTIKDLVIADKRDLDVERARLLALIDRFATGGPSVCTNHPHSFFGVLTPDEWAILMYKHTDHHLRQFGV